MNQKALSFVGPQHNFLKKNKTSLIKKSSSEKTLKRDQDWHKTRNEDLKKFKAERKAKLTKKSHSV